MTDPKLVLLITSLIAIGTLIYKHFSRKKEWRRSRKFESFNHIDTSLSDWIEAAFLLPERSQEWPKKFSKSYGSALMITGNRELELALLTFSEIADVLASNYSHFPPEEIVDYRVNMQVLASEIRKLLRDELR